MTRRLGVSSKARNWREASGYLGLATAHSAFCAMAEGTGQNTEEISRYAAGNQETWMCIQAGNDATPAAQVSFELSRQAVNANVAPGLRLWPMARDGWGLSS